MIKFKWYLNSYKKQDRIDAMEDLILTKGNVILKNFINSMLCVTHFITKILSK